MSELNARVGKTYPAACQECGGSGRVNRVITSGIPGVIGLAVVTDECRCQWSARMQTAAEAFRQARA